MAKFSFLVTYYNQKNFVERSLMSVLNQNLPYDYEILIGDDGSTDGTVEEVNRFVEKYPDKIKLFQMPRNNEPMQKSIHRAAANRINLLKHMHGEYFCVLDGDDYYNNMNFASKGISILDNNKSLSCCAFDFELVYKDRKETYNTGIKKECIINAKNYVKNLYLHSGAFVFRNIFTPEKIDIAEKSKNFDDNLITIFMMQFGDMYYFKELAYSYSQSENSLWNSFSKPEQHLLNTMDYEIISKAAPVFKKELFSRQFQNIKFIYQNKSRLKFLLGDILYEKYIQENKELNNKIVLDFLNWNIINSFRKCELVLWYNSGKIRRQYDKVFRFIQNK